MSYARARSSGPVPPSWQQIRDAGALSGLDIEDDTEFPRPPPPNNLPPLRAFIGRESELALLHGQPPAGTVAILGPAGVGKSALALAFAHRFVHDFRLVWWVRGEAPELIEEDLLSLAILLNLHQGTVQEQQARLEEFFHRNSHWLLVVDDVASPREVRPLLPKSGQGRVLITSTRSESWQGMADACCHLPPLSVVEGMTLFARRAGRETDAEDARLVELLQRDPLAIVVAADCERNTRYRSSDLLGVIGAPVQKAEAAAWDRLGHFALRCLVERSPFGMGVLEVLAFLASGIPLPVLIAGGGQHASRLPDRLPSTIEEW
ncbi:MAG: hypothetical protein HQL66_13465, partial [Magnetococcales bacterium]|nr:hypothetical protein [Magnetococcales bacterium]